LGWKREPSDLVVENELNGNVGHVGECCVVSIENLCPF
jgi:hypothetical protein